MKIGFDVSQTGSNKAGCGFFAYSLISHLAQIDSRNQYILYPTFGNHYWDPIWSESTVSITAPNFSTGIAHKNFEEMQEFWTNPPAEIEKLIGSPDLVHANNFFFPKGLKRTRVIYTLYDLAFLVYPEYTTENNRIACFNGVYFASLYADYVISISEFSLRHFLKVFPHFPTERISVVHGASRFFERQDLPRPAHIPQLIPKEFWLNVGTLEPRKNHLALLKGYALYKERFGKTFPLVLVGPKGWLMERFERKLADLHLLDDVVMPGYVDDTTLQWLYQHCFAFVFPSIFEGFGLPLLEAMTLGAAVIASSRSSLAEIVGDNALLNDPSNEEDICSAMRKLAVDESFCSSHRSALLERARSFSWQKAATRLLELYQRALYDLPPRSLNP